MDTLFKRFPPRGGLLVPLSSPRGAAAALDAYAGCRPAAALAHAAAAAAVRAAGPRVLPGPAEAWRPPLANGDWQALLQDLRRQVHRFDTLAVLERRQPGRAGLGLLLLDGGRPRAFVKLRPRPAAGLAREADALRRAAAAAPRAFTAPALLDWGTSGAWGWLAVTALAGPHHVPRAPRLHEVTAEVRRALAGLPRPAGGTPHWTPMHGDLTPWNLRQAARGGLLLYDWERAGWGPPGADAVLYRVAEAALLGGGHVPGARWLCARWPEAAAFWAARLRARHAADAGEERRLRAQLEILDAGAGAAAPDETGLLGGACAAALDPAPGEDAVPALSDEALAELLAPPVAGAAG
ncbi:MAG TPA: hypothetical protein VF142_21550 [Longimicrobium sp.]